MNDDLEKQLTERFPLIYAHRRGIETIRAEPIYYGFEHGDGWFNIIWQLSLAIQHHIDHRAETREIALAYNTMRNDLLSGRTSPRFDYQYAKYTAEQKAARATEIIGEKELVIPDLVPQVVAEQVKEKFGGLRYYYCGGDDVIDGMVQMAELLSNRTCEVCGDAAVNKNTAGWSGTRCTKHTRK